MNEKLLARSGGKCELCGQETEAVVYNVAPDNHPDNEVVVCQSLLAQIEGRETVDAEDWRFIPEAMWREVPAVQALAWRMLNWLNGESWAAGAHDNLSLEGETLSIGKSTGGER